MPISCKGKFKNRAREKCFLLCSRPIVQPGGNALGILMKMPLGHTFCLYLNSSSSSLASCKEPTRAKGTLDEWIHLLNCLWLHTGLVQYHIYACNLSEMCTFRKRLMWKIWSYTSQHQKSICPSSSCFDYKLGTSKCMAAYSAKCLCP